MKIGSKNPFPIVIILFSFSVYILIIFLLLCFESYSSNLLQGLFHLWMVKLIICMSTKFIRLALNANCLISFPIFIWNVLPSILPDGKRANAVENSKDFSNPPILVWDTPHYCQLQNKSKRSHLISSNRWMWD